MSIKKRLLQQLTVITCPVRVCIRMCVCVCVCSSLFIKEQICSTNVLQMISPSLPVLGGDWHSAPFASRSTDLREILKRVWFPVPFKTFTFSESRTCNMCASPVICLCESDKLAGYFYWRLCLSPVKWDWNSDLPFEMQWPFIITHQSLYESQIFINLSLFLTCTLSNIWPLS